MALQALFCKSAHDFCFLLFSQYRCERRRLALKNKYLMGITLLRTSWFIKSLSVSLIRREKRSQKSDSDLTSITCSVIYLKYFKLKSRISIKQILDIVHKHSARTRRLYGLTCLFHKIHLRPNTCYIFFCIHLTKTVQTCNLYCTENEVQSLLVVFK